jgi:hypothetical protein
VTCYVWQDRTKAVPLIDTTSDPNLETTCHRRAGDLPVPVAVRDYQKYLRGVDRADQLVSYYHFDHKSLRFYIPLFFHIVETVLSNCAVIWRTLHPTQRRLKQQDFREKLAKELLSFHVARMSHGPRPEAQERFTGRHFPSKREERRKCQGENCDKRVQSWCPKCEVALCVFGCFEQYHTPQRH